MSHTRCINIIEIWPQDLEAQPGEPCEFCDQAECECAPGEGANFHDSYYCGGSGHPIETNDGTKYVCDDCRPGVVESGTLNGWSVVQDAE